MKESEIRDTILYPLLINAGYSQDEILFDYPITTYSSNQSDGIKLRPDMVLFDSNKQAILVIETKSPANADSDFKNSIYKSLSYSESLNAPVFAVTDGIKFQLFSRKQGELLFNTNAIDKEYEKLLSVLNKESLKQYFLKSNMDDTVEIEIPLEDEWINRINNEHAC